MSTSAIHQYLFENNGLDVMGTANAVTSTNVSYTTGYLSTYALADGHFIMPQMSATFSHENVKWSIAFNFKRIGIGILNGGIYKYYRDVFSGGGSASESGIYIRIQCIDNEESLFVRVVDGIGGYLNYNATFSTAIGTNVWYEVKYTYDSSRPISEKFRLYVNNNLIPSVVEGVEITSIKTMVNTYIGSYDYDGIPAYRGYVDNFRIYNDVIYPTITSTYPTIPSIGNLLYIYGTNMYGTEPTTLFIDGVDYTDNIVAITPTTISFTIPDILPNTYLLTIVVDGIVSNEYSIQFVTPIILSYSSNRASAGSRIYLTGLYFTGQPVTLSGASGVYDMDGYIISRTDTTMSFIVPDVATSELVPYRFFVGNY